MPRFFFHVHDGTTFPDLQGTELADLDAARAESVRFAGALLLHEGDGFWDHGEWKLRVTDEHDLTLFELLFVGINAAASGGNQRPTPSPAG